MKQATYRILTSLACVLVIVAAHATIIDEDTLLAELQDLETEHEDLESRIDACPGGTCQDAAQIEIDLDAATADLEQAEADREELVRCVCTAVDELLDSVGELNDDLRSQVDNWA